MKLLYIASFTSVTFLVWKVPIDFSVKKKNLDLDMTGALNNLHMKYKFKFKHNLKENQNRKEMFSFLSENSSFQSPFQEGSNKN